MPYPRMHMTEARELAREVGHRVLEYNPGAYYLGATTPDVRAITRWERERTHFFDLHNFEEQSGVAAIFEAYPDLASPGKLNEATVAFLCGYISHLEMDEAWICEVYRPSFGERSPLEGGPLANILDRVLQFELDRRGQEPHVAEAIRRDLLSTDLDIQTGFIDHEALAQWRDISADAVVRGPDLRRLASRHLAAYGVKSEDEIEDFLRNVPDLLEQSIQEVTPERLAVFEERSRRRAREAIEEYLS
jgi:hypothetical protein